MTDAAHHRGGTFPVGTPTTLVADAVQAHVAPEKGHSLSSKRSPPPRRKRGEQDRHQNRSRSRSRGAENGRGTAKGLLAVAGAGAEAARGARVRVDATTKVRATCSKFDPDNIFCERDKIVQFRSGGQRRILSEEVLTVTMLHLYSIYPN